jgi:uncharacterized protein
MIEAALWECFKLPASVLPCGGSPLSQGREAVSLMRDDVLSILRVEQPRLRSDFGVKSLTSFGSVARNEASESSDVDLLVEYDRPVSLFDHVGTALFLEDALGVAKIDLIIRRCVIDELKDRVYASSTKSGPWTWRI